MFQLLFSELLLYKNTYKFLYISSMTINKMKNIEMILQ